MLRLFASRSRSALRLPFAGSPTASRSFQRGFTAAAANSSPSADTLTVFSAEGLKPTWSVASTLPSSAANDNQDLQVDIDRVARLSNLSLSTKEERARLSKNINNMVQWIHQIVDVDASGAQPAYNTVRHTAWMRPDTVTTDDTATQAIRNVPNHDMGYVVVPKVVDTEDS